MHKISLHTENFLHIVGVVRPFIGRWIRFNSIFPHLRRLIQHYQGTLFIFVNLIVDWYIKTMSFTDSGITKKLKKNIRRLAALAIR